MNAEITPTVMEPRMTKIAPNTATSTKDTLLSMFIIGPMELLMICAMIPVFVRSSEVSANFLTAFSC